MKTPHHFFSYSVLVFIIFFALGFELFEVLNAYESAPVFLSAHLQSEPIQLKNKPADLIFDKPITVINFGDIMFDRGVRKIMSQGTNPFELVDEGKFKNADFVSANLEGPITDMDRNLCQKKIYGFKFDASVAELLKNNGINLLNLSNNHILDCYSRGVLDTRKNLAEAGIDFFGGGATSTSFIVENVKGKKIAFVGIDDTLGMTKISDFYPLVKKLKLENNFVVINIHWGTEYNLDFTARQQEIAHNLIDNGADAILGSHPHVIEPVEIYNGKPIFYSLGNFIFDQIGEKQNEGIAVKAVFSDNGNQFEILPYKILNSQPRFLDEEEKNAFCGVYLKEIPNQNVCAFSL